MNMNDLTHAMSEAEFELVDDAAFFAPVASDLIDSLLGQYIAQRLNIDKLAALMNGGDLANVVHYFIDGNCGDDKLHRSLYVDKIFQLDGAVHSLNSAFWSKALALTDVYECMPQERKNEWNQQLRHPEGIKAKHHSYQRDTGKEWESEPLPNFEEGTVRSTITALLNARSQFLAERVDGIFRNLSGHHVTNAPEAFGKRMILANILSSYGTTEHSRAGYLHDMRCVIAKFMGMPEPKHFGTTGLGRDPCRGPRLDPLLRTSNALHTPATYSQRKTR